MDMPSTQQKQTVTATFRRIFPTEEDCIAFLFPLRWPHGFTCPFCRTNHPHLAPQRYITCSHCGNRSSLTTGTLMHGTKKPISDWLLAIWWFSGSRFGTSAKELQRLLDISCYQTAWTWLQKLRLAMGSADTSACRGVVEIGCSTVTPARERKECARVLTAAEVVLSLGITGRIRMQHIARLDKKTLMGFLHETVQGNSSLLIDNETLPRLIEPSASYYVAPTQPGHPSRTEELNRSFETCLHTVHRGGVTIKHLQLYLDEFCFRNNASLLPDHQAVFTALLTGVFNASIEHFRLTSGTCAIDPAARREA